MVDMNVEINRLNTFHTWPNNAPVDAERLARGGFFATGNYLETQCNWCNKKISDWQYGDQTMVRHRRLDPLCPFVLNPTNSGNVPIMTSSSLTESPSQDVVLQGDLKNEMCRLATFKNWPNPNISPQSLAKAGFYYMNKFDQVRCAWCKGILENWRREDNAFLEHKRHFPSCARVQLGPLIEMRSDDLGIQQITPARHPKYASPDARMRTFTRWPINDIQKPEILSQAGFYYQDVDDHVKCFHCNGGLRSWQKEDDPWFEHARWFPNCQFLRLAKGSQYINQVQAKGRQPVKESTTAENHVQIMTVDEAMMTEPVRRALEMGLNVGRVRNATRQHLEYFGKPFETIEHLVEAVLEGQADEEEDDNNEQSSSIVREVSRILDNICFPQNTSGEADYIDNNASTSDEEEPERRPDDSLNISLNNGIRRESLGHDPEVVPDIPDIPDLPAIFDIPDIPDISYDMSVGEQAVSKGIVETKAIPDLQKQQSLEEENRKLKDARLCKVCMDDEVGVVFLPCGHLVTCVHCASGVDMCPLCRTAIKGFVRTFLS